MLSLKASALAAVIVLLLPLRAEANPPDKDACLASFVSAQKERQSGALVSARRDLLVCANEACPAAVKANCSQWIGEVDERTPTVIVAARDDHDRPLVEVRVVVDGAPFAEAIDGKARPLDPGVHEFRFEALGRTATVRASVLEGGKDQLVIGRLLPPALAPAAVFAPLPPAVARPVPATAVVFGGVAIAGLGLFIGAGIAGRENLATLDHAHCAPRCEATNAGNVSAVRRDDVIADVGLAVAAVSLGVATVLYLTRPAAKPAH